MPFARQYLADLGFALTRVTGAIDDEQLRRHVLDFNREADRYAALWEVADCTAVVDVSRLTVQGTVAAASLERDQPRAMGGKLVIVVPDDPVFFGMARVYATIADEIRAAADVSLSLEGALAWLGYSDDQRKTLLDFVRRQS